MCGPAGPGDVTKTAGFSLLYSGLTKSAVHPLGMGYRPVSRFRYCFSCHFEPAGGGWRLGLPSGANRRGHTPGT